MQNEKIFEMAIGRFADSVIFSSSIRLKPRRLGVKYRQPSWKKTKRRPSPFYKATFPTYLVCLWGLQ